VERIATIFKLCAPGMSLNRMPLFVWAILVTSFMILFAMPAVMLASTDLIMDRFWFFGHRRQHDDSDSQRRADFPMH
jgi:heme/copper-type cytochrome/quinol oxidase subunit 1